MSIRNALANTRAAARTIQDTIRNAAMEQTSTAIARHLYQTAERAATNAQQTILLLEAAQEAEAAAEATTTDEDEAKQSTQLQRKTTAITGEKASKRK